MDFNCTELFFESTDADEPAADVEPMADDDPPTEDTPVADDEPPIDEAPVADVDPPTDEEPMADVEPDRDFCFENGLFTFNLEKLVADFLAE